MMVCPLFFFYVAVTVLFLQPTQSIPEGSSVQICSQLSSEAAIPVTVPLLVGGGGTAIQNTDFILSGQSITFPTGAVESCVSISAVDDSILEEDEVFTLALQSSETVLIDSGSTAAITITDQDSMLTECRNLSVMKFYFLWFSLDVTVRMQQGVYTAQEELERVQVCALLIGQIARSVPVTFATSDNTAQGI